jgi:hypothetical protein
VRIQDPGYGWAQQPQVDEPVAGEHEVASTVSVAIGKQATGNRKHATGNRQQENPIPLPLQPPLPPPPLQSMRPESPAWIAFSLSGQKSVEVQAVINPINRSQYLQLSPNDQCWRTGLEGWNLVQPLGTNEKANWSGPMPVFASSENWGGITARTFESSVQRQLVGRFVWQNPRHFRTLEFVQNIGHGLKQDPPPDCSSWEIYYERNAHLVKIPKSLCGGIAYNLGVHQPEGICVSTARMSNDRKDKRALRLKLHLEKMNKKF